MLVFIEKHFFPRNIHPTQIANRGKIKNVPARELTAIIKIKSPSIRSNHLPFLDANHKSEKAMQPIAKPNISLIVYPTQGCI